MFVSRFNNNIISSTRITGFFFTLGVNEDVKANFNCGICIKSIKNEVSSEGDDTDLLLIEAGIDNLIGGILLLL